MTDGRSHDSQVINMGNTGTEPTVISLFINQYPYPSVRGTIDVVVGRFGSFSALSTSRGAGWWLFRGSN